MNKAHIVLIEYNPGDILLVEMALKENDIPYKLTQFDNGLEALRVLYESQRQIRLSRMPEPQR